MMSESVLAFERYFRMIDLRDEYGKGISLTAAGTILASFEGLLVRLLPVDSWTVIFWRGLLLGLAMLAFMLATRRKLAFGKFRGAAWIAIVAYAANVSFFISAINATTVANTLVIASAAPLIAAAIGWIILRERPSKETAVAVVAVFFGLSIIFSGSLGTGRESGDLMAFGYALSLAIYFVALRRCSETQVPGIVALGGLLSACVAWYTAHTLVFPAQHLWVLVALGLVVVPAATLLLSWGPQLIPASHVTLIMLLEIALGPLWVWMVFSEVPATPTILGGALVLATIVVHSWRSAHKRAELRIG
jgi:drug/metabolite transporter (DMT)-like permease